LSTAYKHDNDVYDVTDLFCGAGGSGLGAEAVPGVRLAMAANHWRLAVDTHAENFPHSKHDVADISQVNPRRYRRTRILWASPECTKHSQARGKKRDAAQPDLFGDRLPDEATERSRATMWDVPRFAEHHLYDAIIVENVVEVVQWAMFDAFLMAMASIGYRHQIVYLNSMHAPAVNAPRAPQSRDRVYIVFTRIGAKAPNLDIRPAAWCPTCEQVVDAVQWWKKPGKPWGRYRQQYVYRCPNAECRHRIVEPFADPAAAAIDWSMPGQRIGDRAKPLSAKTVARIEAGLRRYAGKPMTFEHRGNTFVRYGPDGRPVYARAWPVDEPTATLTTSETRALVVPLRTHGTAGPVAEPMKTVVAGNTGHALVVPSGGTWNEDARPVDEPMRTRTGRETDGVVVPPLVVPVEGRDGLAARTVDDPMRTQTGRAESALVVPYYSRGVARPTGEPMPTMTTVDTAGVAFIAELRGGHSDARSVADPLATVTASGNHHALVEHHMVMRNNDGGAEMCTPAAEPLRTLTAAGHQSIVGWPHAIPDVEDCTFRMLEPHEIGAAMAFHRGYRVLGNRRERVRQFGNAVTPPAAEWLIRMVIQALEGTDAA
jgi:DNA (cytosine-5)-methyltransferase 1